MHNEIFKARYQVKTMPNGLAPASPQPEQATLQLLPERIVVLALIAAVFVRRDDDHGKLVDQAIDILEHGFGRPGQLGERDRAAEDDPAPVGRQIGLGGAKHRHELVRACTVKRR